MRARPHVAEPDPAVTARGVARAMTD